MLCARRRRFYTDNTMHPAAPPIRSAPAKRRIGHGVLALVVLAACLLSALQAGAQELLDFDVQAQRRDGLIDVRARATVRAPMAVVWQTLTDYERLPDFIPGMESSRVLARQGSRVTVAQRGVAQFLFLSVPIAVTLESIEQPPHVLAVRRIAGSLRHLEGRYDAMPLADGLLVRLRWTGSVSPPDDLPALIGTTLVRLLIQDQFEGMVREIQRRAGYSEPAPADPVRSVR